MLPSNEILIHLICYEFGRLHFTFLTITKRFNVTKWYIHIFPLKFYHSSSLEKLFLIVSNCTQFFSTNRRITVIISISHSVVEYLRSPHAKFTLPPRA